MPMPVQPKKITLRALEFAERRARYAFLSAFVEGARAIELLDPEALLEPGAPFLEALGAASAHTLPARPEAGCPLPSLDELGAPPLASGAAQPLLIVDDGLSWLAATERFEELLTALGAAAPDARLALVLRHPAGTALASLDGRTTRDLAARFDFAAIERALAARFAEVRFATQSAVWGSQLAPLAEGEALDCAIDGRLSEPAAAAFFIALCAREPFELPREWTLVPIDPRPLARCADRFEKLADALHRAETGRARAESRLCHQRDERRQLDELERRLAESSAARSALEERCQKAEARSARTEHLLDELAAERTALLARIEAAEQESAALKKACAEGERLRCEAEARRDQAQGEREAHLRLAKAATDQLQARIAALEEALSSAQGQLQGQQGQVREQGHSGGDGRALADVGAPAPELASMAQEIEAQAARIEQLDRLVLEQDARIEAFDALERKFELARAAQIQGEARAAEFEARLLERSFLIDALAEEIEAMDRAVDRLARQRNGKAIAALLELHEQLRADRPPFPAGGTGEDGPADEGGDGDNDEDDDDGEEALI